MAGEKFIALESTSQEIKTAVEGVKTDVGAVKTDVGGVKTDTEDIKSQLSGGSGIIRHIQQGIIKTSRGNPTNISLAGFTNINKMIYLINGFAGNGSNTENIYVSEFAINNIQINAYNPGAKGADYQVIEFY